MHQRSGNGHFPEAAGVSAIILMFCFIYFIATRAEILQSLRVCSLPFCMAVFELTQRGKAIGLLRAHVNWQNAQTNSSSIALKWSRMTACAKCYINVNSEKMYFQFQIFVIADSLAVRHLFKYPLTYSFKAKRKRATCSHASAAWIIHQP